MLGRGALERARGIRYSARPRRASGRRGRARPRGCGGLRRLRWIASIPRRCCPRRTSTTPRSFHAGGSEGSSATACSRSSSARVSEPSTVASRARSRNSVARRGSGRWADGSGGTGGADGKGVSGARSVIGSPTAPNITTTPRASTNRRGRARVSAWKRGRSVLASTRAFRSMAVSASYSRLISTACRRYSARPHRPRPGRAPASSVDRRCRPRPGPSIAGTRVSPRRVERRRGREAAS